MIGSKKVPQQQTCIFYRFLVTVSNDHNSITVENKQNDYSYFKIVMTSPTYSLCTDFISWDTLYLFKSYLNSPTSLFLQYTFLIRLNA
jgi:hypothetical protein